MKNLKIALFLMLTFFAFASCSESTDNAPRMTNYVTLAINGESSIHEDATDGIDVTVSLAYTVKKDVTVTLSLQGNEKDVVKLSSDIVTFKAGEKNATVKLTSNNRNILSTQQVVKITATAFSETNMAAINDGVSITIRPSASVPTLSAKQLELIKGYQQKLGIDLSKILGIVDVTTTITFGNEDKETENNGIDTRILQGKSIITLSENATADKPVLKMLSNPMGMTTFIYEKMRRCTVEDQEFFMQQPIPSAYIAALNYDLAKETFDVVLDNITLNTDGTLNFTAVGKDNNDDNITMVPFVYTYSLWDRLVQMGKDGKTIQVLEGETTVEHSVQELLDTYPYLKPSYYLGNSDITKDTYESEPSNFIKPASKYDFKTGKLTFDFAWDYGASEVLSDYVRINVVYTMHK